MIQTPPHNADLERALLGAAMFSQTALSVLVQRVTPEMMYIPAHRTICQAIRSQFDQGRAVDLLTVSQALRDSKEIDEVGGFPYLAEVVEHNRAANADQYASLLLELHFRRGIIEAAADMGRAAMNEPDGLVALEEAEAALFALGQRRFSTQFEHIGGAAQSLFEKIVTLDPGTRLAGLATGFGPLDALLAGLKKGEMVVIAARPSMGKTAFALAAGRNMAKAKVPVGMFSMEMSAEALANRLLAAEAGVDGQRLQTGEIKDGEWKKLAEALERLKDMPLYIDDAPLLSATEFRSKARRLVAEQGVEAIFIDYLQFMHIPKSESRQIEISMISRTVKATAKELNIPIIALAQLNRLVETRADKRPMLSDLRESGSIEQDADVVAFIHRPEHYEILTFEDGTPTEGMVEIIAGKQRNGPVGSVKLTFDKPTGRFGLPVFADEPEYFD